MPSEAQESHSLDQALNAIHDEALRLLPHIPSDSKELRVGVDLIISIARYKHDVRSEHEKAER